MVFFGKEIIPGSTFLLDYDDDRRTLHLTHATLGTAKGTTRTVLQCKTVGSRPTNLCSLIPGKFENAPLQLKFKELDEVLFTVKGPDSIFITGFYDVDADDGYPDSSDEFGGDSDSFDESTRTNPDGLAIEEVAMGKLDGRKASRGKNVIS